MDIKIIHIIKDFKQAAQLWQSAKSYLKHDIDTPENILKHLCSNEIKGNYHDCVKLELPFTNKGLYFIVNPFLARAVLKSSHTQRDKRPIKLVTLTGKRGIASSLQKIWERQRSQLTTFLTPEIIVHQYHDIEKKIIDKLISQINDDLAERKEVMLSPDTYFKRLSFSMLSEEMGFALSSNIIADLYSVVSDSFHSMTKASGVLKIIFDKTGTSRKRLKADSALSRVIKAFDRSIETTAITIFDATVSDEQYKPKTFMQSLVYFHASQLAREKIFWNAIEKHHSKCRIFFMRYYACILVWPFYP